MPLRFEQAKSAKLVDPKSISLNWQSLKAMQACMTAAVAKRLQFSTTLLLRFEWVFFRRRLQILKATADRVSSFDGLS